MQTALQARWTIWTNATTEQAARKVAARLLFWLLTGDVLNTLDGWSNESRVSGVTNLHWQLWREG